MIAMSLAEIAAVVDGTVHGDAEVVVTGAAFLDSRHPTPGGLFVAMVGEHVDGHAHAEAAVAAGAAAVLASRAPAAPAVVVDDVVLALGRLARHVVDRLPDLVVLALTGSQGKTGTKDYLAQVLAAAAPTVATEGNYNNELGVPLTVLRADAGTAYLVVEMGARGLGHIGYLADLARPRVAAVINVGTAHVGEFGGREAIAEAKGEIVVGLPPEGVAVLNSDDPLTMAMATRTRARVLTFGSAGDVSWRGLELDALGRPSFELGYEGHWAAVRLSQPGSHQVANAAAAAALAVAAGLRLPDVAAALCASTARSRWRMELHERADGVVVVNDAYNANPESMRAALDALASIGRSGTGPAGSGGARRRTVAVLGEMRELGADAEAAHTGVGRYAATLGVDVLVGVGAAGDQLLAGAAAVPGWHGVPVPTAGRDQALDWVRNNVTAGDVVLVKASRGVALEYVADGLLAETEPAAPHPAEQGDPAR